ncbi:MAG: hypothetical protein L6W00_04895 [Lentisphaeria bacterium]|nr:MAG: hypothetical protein L6W00_04895 [Lentisphaeria bacterium]
MPTFCSPATAKWRSPSTPKVGPDEGGTLHKLSSFTIDFRLFPDNDRDSYYPMLKSFSFRPTTEWQRFSRRFPVKAYTNYYNIWVMPSAVKSGGTLNSLYLDNFQLRYVDGRKTDEPEEYCVIPDRDDQLYRRGDTVRFAVRARLADAADSLDAELAVLRDYNNSELAALPLRLTRRADGTWTGSASWKAGEYGSFTTVLRRKGNRSAASTPAFRCFTRPSRIHSAPSAGESGSTTRRSARSAAPSGRGRRITASVTPASSGSTGC